jgi:hypothetical protein
MRTARASPPRERGSVLLWIYLTEALDKPQTHLALGARGKPMSVSPARPKVLPAERSWIRAVVHVSRTSA